MISKATEKDYPAIIEVWEQSVRATHHFLPEDYLQEIKTLLPSILPAVPVYIFKTEKGTIKGILGVAEQKIEMLFIHPGSRGQGIGKLLTRFAVDELKADKVDVNEQNEQAVGFYMKMGFVQKGRTDTDSMGRPFPLLLMELPTVK
jgi:putative acetyltransferase